MRRFKTAVKQNNNFFYLIDSNGRNMQGLSFANVTSLMLKFASRLEVESYI